ncbi:MAG: hypothetical protein HY237_10425 [Acidobacteria bacterium]|nr:hypothetical protein [Acidobacteriota bacterium]
MDNELRQRLEKLTRAEQEKRLEELAVKLEVAHSRVLDGDDPQLLDAAGYEEYTALKRILGFIVFRTGLIGH